MKYLTVGTDNILFDKFCKVQDTNKHGSMKPLGGMWFTEYDKEQNNEWVQFMMNHIYIWFYKDNNVVVNGRINPFMKPCSVVSLNPDVRLYMLHNYQTLDYLMKCFPKDGKFSYEELSKYYDGIYVNLNGLFHSKYDKEVLNKFSSFGISSLVLFHLDCIDYYQSGRVILTPFDYECGERPQGYEIKIDDTRKKILKK